MAVGRVQGVVLPVHNSTEAPYLDTLVGRGRRPTNFIWGWQSERAKRMRTPARLIRRLQGLVPFLFSPLEQDENAVTHVAVCGVVLNDDDRATEVLKTWMTQHRVETFALNEKKDWDGLSNYVVAGGMQLREPIRYADLTLVNGNRPLNQGMRRGYAVVYLPDSLTGWWRGADMIWASALVDVPVGVRSEFDRWGYAGGVNANRQPV